ncbi:hypothetical protein B0A48_02304 [Cryoendolithus antarcticus]|uniref:Biogenesis of lysosome-related organelles complex 1 subunit 1 n=1 Tax=Cryoendolithus antarcticus TaxID=1507870 RepID=A0A1V8TN96_9PEZI|nr:hypothetical protein B0A48_02304 [Cryoendolithus antarcticus]
MVAASGSVPETAASSSTPSTTAIASPPSSTAAASPNPDSGPSTEDATRAQAEARTAVLASLNSAGSSYSHDLQTRARDLHANSAAISAQESDLTRNTAALKTETAKLSKEVDGTMKGMRELGDLQNWTEMLERDFMVLEETVRLAEGGEEVGRESGGSLWR